jgi:putative ABC transport system permease protein
MNFSEAIKLAFDAIWAHKLRSFLTLLGVIFGVATVIVVVSLIEGFNSYVDEKIADIGTNAFAVQKFSIEDFSSVERLEEARRRNKDIRFEDYEILKAARGSYIADVAAQGGQAGEVTYANERLFEVSIVGQTSNMADINRVEFSEGRNFTPAEEEKNRAICYIGADIAERFFPTRTPIGEFIKIDGKPYEVIGVAKAQGSVFGQSRDKFVRLPLTSFLNEYGARRSLSISVTSTGPETYLDALDQINVLMRTRRKLAPNETNNFGLITPNAINALREKIFGTIQTAAIGVTSIALVVGAIVIMNIMLVSVTERTKEIGIRKSLGARQQDILKQFLCESTALSLTGGIIGITIAWSLARLVSLLTPIPTALPLLAVAVAMFVCGSIGLLSGLYPAWKAARLDPIVALRAD